MAKRKDVLHELGDAKPGNRFLRLYRKRQQSRYGKVANVAFMITGVAVVALGVVTYPIPVIPSEIVIVLGVALFAQGSSWAARGLDRAELFFRDHFGWLIRKWRPLPGAVKWGIYGLWVAALTSLSYFTYRSLS